MKRIKMFILATLAVAALPALAGEEVFLLQTQENAAVPALCPAQDNVRLGAMVYAPQTHHHTGLVKAGLGKPIGTAVGCGVMTSIAPWNFTAPAPFSMVFDLGEDLAVTASGYCVVANQSFPIWPTPAPLLLVGCTLSVDPDPARGIVRGIATSSSVFLPVAIPGYQTGSFWTIHLYTAEPAAK